MNEFWSNIKSYFAKSADTKLTVGSFTISRLAVFGLAALILLVALFALIYLMYGSNEIELVLDRTPVNVHYRYRINDSVVSYQTDTALVKFDATTDKELASADLNAAIDGYDVSDTLTIVYSGNVVKVQDRQGFTLSGGTVQDVRVGKSHAAVLFLNPTGETRILLLRVKANSLETVNTIVFSASSVVAFDFVSTGDHELLWVSTIDVGQFAEESIVRIYDCALDGALTYYSSPFYNQTIHDLFLSEQCMFLIGTQDIIRYDREEDGGFTPEKHRARIYGSHVVDFTVVEESAYFLVVPDIQNEAGSHLFRLITISQTDDPWATMMQIHTASPVVGAFLQHSQIRVLTQTHFTIYSYTGSQREQLELSEVPVFAHRYSEDAFLLFTNDDCYRATLKE